MLRKIILTLLALLILSCCGNLHDKFGRTSGGVTSVNFRLGNASPATTVLNGVMVYAVRQDDTNKKASRFLPTDQSQVQWALPNGVYKFFTVGYTNGNPITGAMYCGLSQDIPLAGGAVTVPILMSGAGICGLPPFAPSGFAGDANQPYGLKLGICAPTGGNIASITPPSALCDSSAGRPASVSAYSYRVSLPEFNGLGNGAPLVNNAAQLSTGCQTLSFNGAAPATLTGAFPFGPPFLMKIEAWDSSGCGGNHLGTTFLNAGVVNAATNSLNTYFGPSGQFSPAAQMGNTVPNNTSIYLMLRQVP